MLRLEKILFKKIDSNFSLPNKVMQLTVENSVSLDIMHSDDRKGVKGILKNNLYAKGMESDFHVFVIVEGYFACNGDEENKEVFDAVYASMFPHVQIMVSDLFVKAGLPPYTLEMKMLTPQNANNIVSMVGPGNVPLS